MNAITKLVSTIEVGEPISSGSLFMFPLFGGTSAGDEPLTLDQGIETGAVHVSETSSEGSVPELLVTNRAARALFLLDGEQVVGVKQNRTFNLSMLLPAGSETVVPVSCLERGRWSSRHGRVQASEHVHFARGRANKMRSVSESLEQRGHYRSDQGRVWSDIDAKFQMAGRRSSTAAEADYYEERRSELQPEEAAFKPQVGQTGALFGFGERFAGVDLFASPQLYEALCEKLLKSYLLDGLDVPLPAQPPARDVAAEKLRQLFLQPTNAFPAPGSGQTHRWMVGTGAAAALVADERCLHAVAFCDAD